MTLIIPRPLICLQLRAQSDGKDRIDLYIGTRAEGLTEINRLSPSMENRKPNLLIQLDRFGVTDLRPIFWTTDSWKILI
jgi:hypothetical protein